LTQFRKLENGFLIAPRRGETPMPPEGYEVAFGDPYVFLPILIKCKYREKRIIKRSCCEPMERIFCGKQQAFATRLQCQECKDAEF